MGFRDLYITGNLMMVTQILIDVGCYHLRSRDRLDYGCRPACAVSSGKYPWHILERSRTLRDNLAPLYRNSRFLKMAGLDILSNRNDQHVARDIDILLASRLNACPSVADRADHLRRYIDAFYMAFFIHINGCRCL